MGVRNSIKNSSLNIEVEQNKKEPTNNQKAYYLGYRSICIS